MDGEKQPSFRIKVVPSQISNDHEVHFFADETNLIDFFGDANVGLDPWDVLKDTCQLRTQSTPHEALIGLCGCGCLGCGDLEVEIRIEGDQVVWTDTYAPKQVRFSASQYDAEIERALSDHSWETPVRTAERLIASTIDLAALDAQGFKFDWASGRCAEGMMTVCLILFPGPYQVLVKMPWSGGDIIEIVSVFRDLLRQPPNRWPTVDYYPQKRDLPPPPFITSNSK